MVETVEGVCQVVDVSANLVGRQFGSRTLHGALEARKLHHQILFGSAYGIHKLCRIRAAALFLILVQDGLDADNGVKDVRTGITLKGGKAV